MPQACKARGTVHCFVKWEDKIISRQVAQEARKYHLAIGSHFSNNINITLLDSSKNDLQDRSMLIYVMKYRYNHPHLL